MFGEFQAFQVISECFRMIPERPWPFSEGSGPVEVPPNQNYPKRNPTKKVGGRKMKYRGTSETVFAEVSGHGGPIQRGKWPFQVWSPLSEGRSERSKACSYSKRVYWMRFVEYRSGNER